MRRLETMGFPGINYKDIRTSKYNDAREIVRKLSDNFNERSKAIKSSSTMGAEAI